jgi:hypothetical protein
MGASLDALIPELIPAARQLVDVANRAGVQPRVTSTLRTRTEQARLYRRFLAGASRYPAAPPGRSAHEFGYAFDVVVIGDENLNDLGQVWESWGGVWGGANRDPIHFEYPGFRPPPAGTPAEARTPFNIGEILFNPIGVATAVSPELAKVVDFILGFAPGIGEAELVGELLALGFGESEISTVLSHPVESLGKLVSP